MLIRTLFCVFLYFIIYLFFKIKLKTRHNFLFPRKKTTNTLFHFSNQNLSICCKSDFSRAFCLATNIKKYFLEPTLNSLKMLCINFLKLNIRRILSYYRHYYYYMTGFSFKNQNQRRKLSTDPCK